MCTHIYYIRSYSPKEHSTFHKFHEITLIVNDILDNFYVWITSTVRRNLMNEDHEARWEDGLDVEKRVVIG